ncbi:MAG: biotin/lipoyl-binding protein [Marinilabiliales bacterium]|nr:biotin/lipoyl-binding protein [Marinilabiliales bacterium]
MMSLWPRSRWSGRRAATWSNGCCRKREKNNESQNLFTYFRGGGRDPGGRRLLPQVEPPAKPAPAVVAKEITRRTVRSELTLTGTIEPDRSARLAAQVDGEVLALDVREGTAVREGQVLVRIDPSRLAAALDGGPGRQPGRSSPADRCAPRPGKGPGAL